MEGGLGKRASQGDFESVSSTEAVWEGGLQGVSVSVSSGSPSKQDELGRSSDYTSQRVHGAREGKETGLMFLLHVYSSC